MWTSRFMIPIVNPRYAPRHDLKCKGKDAVVLQWSRRVLFSLSQAIEPVGGYTTESVTHMASVTPDLRLPSQPQSTTALWPVPNDTAW